MIVDHSMLYPLAHDLQVRLEARTDREWSVFAAVNHLDFHFDCQCEAFNCDTPNHSLLDYPTVPAWRKLTASDLELILAAHSRYLLEHPRPIHMGDADAA